MPRIHLCFLWHMHQPFYKDLMSGQYRLPWTRLHALKDYYGMVRVLEEFPKIRQTFNLVPSMMAQVEEYASGAADDPFLACALKPAESLTAEEQGFILRYFFQANPQRMIYRFARYGELYDAYVGAERNVERARRVFGTQAFRDLQVLSQLAWFEEEFLNHDPEVIELVIKGSHYSREDQAVMGRKQREILALVVPEYQRLAKSGQIEISTTPYYHPILPLVCDSNVAGLSHPGVALPSRFRYPEDARHQLQTAREYIVERFGVEPAGFWPSEGSVSDEVFEIAADLGFRWTATDNGVLDRTLGRVAGIDGIYRPYEWRQGQRRMHVIFRDHFLSDLIGFVYSRMHAADAASDFLHRIRENCRGILNAGRTPLVPIILDGENAWEYFDRNGRPFLRELYRQISDDDGMVAVTASEAFAQLESEPLGSIFPGSWINANFDVWIGAEEDNRAWEYLLRARRAYDEVTDVPDERRKLAYEELLIAEGSDWCWWYGPEHDSANRPEFDQLFRDHLANVYRALGLQPPEELSRPILKAEGHAAADQPTGPVTPRVDGEISSYFEWMGAGVYRQDPRSGAMHGKRNILRTLYYGADDRGLALRLDFAVPADVGPETEVRLVLEGAGRATLRVNGGGARAEESDWGPDALECAFGSILEVRVDAALAGLARPQEARLQLSVWQNGLPMDAIPAHGWLSFEPRDAASDWVP